jgi:hypothetical protein
VGTKYIIITDSILKIKRTDFFNVVHIIILCNTECIWNLVQKALGKCSLEREEADGRITFTWILGRQVMRM